MKTMEEKLNNFGVKVVQEKPPMFERCKKEFGITWANTIFANDPFIHASKNISEDVLEHELVHIRQQREFGGAEKWWDEYFVNKKQRLEWELEAYRTQYLFLREKVREDLLDKHVFFWAGNLSGEGYGHIIKYWDAVDRIRN